MFILIVILLVYPTTTTTAIEFNTMDTCLAAKKVLLKQIPDSIPSSISAICVEK